MNRVLALVHDPHGTESPEAARAVVGAALEGEGTLDLTQSGPLTLAWASDGDDDGPRSAEGWTCLIDGHVYNLDELDTAVPATHSNGSPPPPEQLLALTFARTGEALIPTLRGDFTIVFWNEAQRRGLVACDHLGGRTAVYHSSGAKLLLASEARNTAAMLPRRPEPDLASLAHWIGISGPPADRTLFEGLRRVRPGHLLRFGEGTPEQRRFWRPAYQGTQRVTRDEAASLIRGALSRSIARRSPAGEQTGVMLSGGMDSTTVSALAMRTLPPERRPLAGYSAVFPSHSDVDESALIERVTDKIGIPSFRISVEDGSVLSGALEYMDRWQVPPTSPNLFFWFPMLRRAAEDGVVALLDGEGGDEIFGYSGYLVADRLRRGRLLSMLSLIRSFPTGDPSPPPNRIKDRILSYGRPAIPAWARRLKRQMSTPEIENPSWFLDTTSHAYADTDEEWSWLETPGPRWAAWWAHTLTWTAGPVAAYDHIRHRARFAGLEARHPMNDVDVIELMLSLPHQYAFDYRHDRPLLRRATAGILPDEVRLRPDKSFFDQVFHGILQGHDLPVVRRLLAPGEAELGAYVDLDELWRVLLEGEPPRVPGDERTHWCVQVWRLATAECWLRTQADASFPEQMLSGGELRRASYELLAPF